MKTQHTPGPWRTGGCGDDGWRMIIGAQTRFLTAYKETYLTDIAATSCSDNPEEDLANARLIASAPTMFDYLTLLALRGDNEAHEIIKKIAGS